MLTAPWLRAPRLLLEQPLAGVAVVVAAAVLGLVVAAGPLFVSSVAAAALHGAARRQCTQDDQISVVNPTANAIGSVVAGPQPAARVRASDPLIRAAFARERLPAPLLTLYGAVPTGTGPAARPDQLGLFTTPGALRHVTVLSRVPGNGVYVTDTYAAAHGLRPGDQLRLPSGRLRVAGIYRDLDDAGYRTVLPAFWCHWRDRIVTSVSSRPPPFVLADPGTVAGLGPDLAAEWTSPVRIGSLSVAEARQVAAAGRRLLTPAETDLDHPRAVLAGYAERTSLDFDLRQTAQLQAAVGTPVLAIAAAGGVLSLLLVAGAALFWVQRRRSELALLSARGVGPAALGVKAALELALPAAAGCAAGWAAALGLVPLLGPSASTEPGAPGRALAAVAGAWVAAVAAALVAAAIGLAEPRRRGVPLRWVGVAAVVAPLGAAAWLLRVADLDQWVLPGVHRIPPALLLAPVLGLAGLAVAGALLGAAPLLQVRRAVRGAAFPLFAAVNRAAAARAALAAAVCGLALPVGLAVYAAGFTASASATVAAKAEAFTGAPVAFGLRVHVGGLPDLGHLATPVSYALGEATGPTTAGTTSDGTEVEVLGIDPRTFAEYAYADRDVTGAPLADLLGRLGATSADGPTPALLVGDGGGPAPTAVRVRATTLPVTVVGRAPAFPGLRYPYHPAVVVDIHAVAGLDPFGGWQNELWTDQEHASDVLAALGRRQVLTDDVQRPAGFLDAVSLLPVTWTFDFLRAVAILVAVSSAAGLLLFLAARQRRQQTAYVLMRRMGLGRATHLRSLLLELGLLAAWAWVTGVATGAGALVIAARTIDVEPGYLPPTLLRLPTATITGIAVGLAAVAVALAAWTQRHADRARPSELLRS